MSSTAVPAVLLQRMNSLGQTFGVEPPFAEPAETSDGLMTPCESDRASAVGTLFAWMRGFVDKIVDRVMTEDPEAFSTTRRDLLRDLLPYRHRGRK